MEQLKTVPNRRGGILRETAGWLTLALAVALFAGATQSIHQKTPWYDHVTGYDQTLRQLASRLPHSAAPASRAAARNTSHYAAADRAVIRLQANRADTPALRKLIAHDIAGRGGQPLGWTSNDNRLHTLDAVVNDDGERSLLRLRQANDDRYRQTQWARELAAGTTAAPPRHPVTVQLHASGTDWRTTYALLANIIANIAAGYLLWPCRQPAPRGRAGWPSTVIVAAVTVATAAAGIVMVFLMVLSLAASP